MKSVLIGNGVDIEFGGQCYTSSSIIIRAIEKITNSTLPREITNFDLSYVRKLLDSLFDSAKELLSGKWNGNPKTKSERDAISKFRKNYGGKKISNLEDIGFEDYFLIYDLFCNRLNIQNPNKYNIRNFLKDLFLCSIHNDGKINEIYNSFPKKFVDYLIDFDEIFTTNYDNNLENATGKQVKHLHGAFHIRADIYDEKSLRNKLSDKPINNVRFDESIYYVYSNSVMTYSSDYKNFQINQNNVANNVSNKMVNLYLMDSNKRKEIDLWCNDDNKIVRNIGESIVLKAKNPELSFPIIYPIEEFKALNNELTVIGLSPFNDYHIYEIIHKNPGIEHVSYYLKDMSLGDDIKKMLTHPTDLYDVSKFWLEMRT